MTVKQNRIVKSCLFQPYFSRKSLSVARVEVLYNARVSLIYTIHQSIMRLNDAEDTESLKPLFFILLRLRLRLVAKAFHLQRRRTGILFVGQEH